MNTLFEVLDYLRELNLVSVAFRLLCAMFFGGLIGLERERKGRPAGFRTYMIVCLGASLTMLLSQYEAFMLSDRWASRFTGGVTDVTRFGAQVINGIGFLGAGTIIVTGRQEVKGITTAAGLWASACMGLAIGASFYECMLVGFALIFLSIRVFPLLENAALTTTRYLNIYVEFTSPGEIGTFIKRLKDEDIKVFEIEMEEEQDHRLMRPSAVFYLYLAQKTPHAEILAALSSESSICAIEEI